ncbi:XRE family transcriptional regulator [Streptomyces sp. WAC07061]|uniref:helix-turn-helix domain-containing protein n=1 Tax=Streptomyces sp. WAC07061 TaxID=2487410 RepID=UPI000F76BFCC|nr:helix-turn-helix transcriptional regulator [Streptomyces sp. WAC07061]RSS56261.1 XRE family transcriptional regulator [Streptomyces sp. WAC07061]
MGAQDNTPEAAELVAMLRRLRAARGNPTLGAISHRTATSSRRLGSYASTATLSRLFSGKALPSAWVVETAALALGADGQELTALMAQYDKAHRERHRAMLRPASRQPRPAGTRAALAPRADLQRFQEALRALVRASGLTLRQLEQRARVPRSTISDALNQPRPPRPDVVRAIAEACGADEPERWFQEAAGLAHHPEEPAPEAAEEVRGEAVLAPHDALVEAAAMRSPAEIAALARSLGANGHGEVAARLVRAAARERTVEEVTDLALALLHAEPVGEERRPDVPAQRQEPSGWRRWRTVRG